MIKWDNQTTQTTTAGGIAVTIRTGKSQGFCNLITRLRLQGRRDVLAEIDAFDERMTALPRSQGDCPNVPEFAVYERDDVFIVFAWGLVLLDPRQRRGDFRFVIVLESELAGVLSSVFDLERTLTVA